MDPLIDAVFQYLGVFAAAALSALIVQLLRKVGLSLDADRQAQVEYFARMAVAKAEELGAAYAKKHAVKMDPAHKLQIATQALIAKVPRITPDEAQDIVTAALPGMKMGAAAAMGKLGDALRSR